MKNQINAIFSSSFVVFLLSAVVFAGDYPEKIKINGFVIGPQAWSFKEFTFIEAIDKAKQAGCSAIEAFPGQKFSPDEETGFDHNASPAIWAKAKIKLEQTGVRLVNYGVVNWQNAAEARKVFDFAKVMGIPAITTEPRDTSVEMMDFIESLIKEYNIKVGLHNHPVRENDPDYIWWDPDRVLEKVKNRDPRFGAACDTGHWVRSGIKPIDGLKTLEGRIISVHLKDLNEFDRDAHDVPYGTGVTDVKAVLDELVAQNFEGNISIEYEYNWKNNVPEITKCVDFVRTYQAP